MFQGRQLVGLDIPGNNVAKASALFARKARKELAGKTNKFACRNNN